MIGRDNEDCYRRNDLVWKAGTIRSAAAMGHMTATSGKGEAPSARESGKRDKPYCPAARVLFTGHAALGRVVRAMTEAVSSNPPDRGSQIALSVIVPVYRGAATIEELNRRVAAALTPRGLRYEILFVEDCGCDNSWEVIRAMAAADPHVRGFCMRRNYGQHCAILLGVRAARGAIIATMDDDLQHAPEDLPLLLDALRPDVDAVYGASQKEQHGLLRDLASQITKLALQKSLGVDAARHVSAFRVFRTALRDVFANYNSPAVNIDVLLTWATTRYAVVRVAHRSRQFGESGYTALKLVGHAMNMITGFTTLPLRLASVTGFVFALFGALVLAFVVARYLWHGGSIPGFPFLASIVAIFSGAQLLALGVIGEYLARMYQQAMGKPAYVLKEITGKEG